ncbi:hypothetical protein [Saccharopolyspora hattusasensis]|uniref:hypothetical protein n=1 Tax=Saccharopolyspora hattusasensis TaxID=1128679 RepID=UPI003D981350
MAGGRLQAAAGIALTATTVGRAELPIRAAGSPTAIRPASSGAGGCSTAGPEH